MKLNSIQVKVLTLILLTMIISIAFVSFFTVNRQTNDALELTNVYLSTTTEQLNITIRNIMLNGEAPIAVRTLSNLQDSSSLKDIDIYRSTGQRAFSDNSTLEEVNERLRRNYYDKQFEVTDRLENKTINNQYFQQVVESPTPVSVEFPEKQEIQYYFPILNYPDCRQCHGEKPFIRGIAYINISTENTYNSINTTRNILVTFFIIVAVALIVILLIFLRWLIIKPLLVIGKTASEVEEGNFKSRVNINNKDELGDIANRINAMIKSVEERVALSKYVSKSTDEIISKGGNIDEGNKRIITVLFSDIRGFTSYTENNEPKVVIDNLNRILQVQSEVVEKYEGDIDKFVGDELMAIFADEYKAVLSAYEMIKKVIEIDKEYNTTLHVGIGVNTGEIIAGNIGSGNRREYAVIGDTINLGSRLCDKAKSDMIVISDSLAESLKDKIKATTIPHQKIKGKKKKIHFYVVNAIYNDDSDEWIKLHDEKEILSKYLTFPLKTDSGDDNNNEEEEDTN